MKNNDLLVALGGHIDHGKTSLIKALNGFDGDGLSEEKKRGITLDISFSNLCFPQRNVAFIDVPGHEKLVKNMIAGAFGVDLLCLVIASDDGIMPQTLEHLKIANFLKIQRSVCIITKTDKGTKSQIDSLCEEIRVMFEPLNIKLDCILPFSLYSQQEDKKAILEYFAHTPKPPKKEIGFFRYYIDRAFSLSGVGCVVSGSSLSGEVKKGDKLLVYDLSKEVIVRSLKIHSDFASSALSSHRVALNLSGVHSSELKRGYLIAPKGFLRGFDRLDVVLFEDKPLPPFATLHIGAKRVEVKITLLAKLSDTHTLAYLRCSEKIFAVFKEAFVLRSGNQTLCGGEILSPIYDPLKKSQKIALLKSLKKEDFHSSFALLLQAHHKGFGLISSLQRFGLSHTQALGIAKDLQNVFIDQKNLVLYSSIACEKLEQIILRIFEKNPQALLSASSLHLKYLWASEPFLQFILDRLLKQGRLGKKNGLYISLNNQIKNPQDFVTDKIYETLYQQGYAPLAPYNIYESLHIDRRSGDQALKKLCASQKVVRLKHNLFITSKHLNILLGLMREIIQECGYIDFALFKERFSSSRKYLIAYLDYLDCFEDIQKVGDRRIFKHKRS